MGNYRMSQTSSLSPVLIIGAGGMLGRAFTLLLGPKAVSLTHLQCDITDTKSLSRHISTLKPSAVINCAAITNVDLCEQNPSLADRVNAAAVTQLAKICKIYASTLIHFSTDSVFDGEGEAPWREQYPRNPINVYGQTKVKAEEAIEVLSPDYLIARVQWVFGPGRNNFIGDTALKLQQGKEVRAFEDQWGTPGYSQDIARLVLKLYELKHRGIFHVTNSGYATRIEIAEEIARQMGVSSSLIIPIKIKDLSLPAARARNSRLSIDKIKNLGIHPSSWQDAIHRYLN